jgi:hypothetical protein
VRIQAGVTGDPVFDTFLSTFVPLTSNLTRQEISMPSAGCALLSQIGSASLVSHSIGALFPMFLSNQCPELVVGNVKVEPGNFPFQSYTGNATSSVGRTSNRRWGLTNIAITYDPPVVSASDLRTITVGEDTLGLRAYPAN